MHPIGFRGKISGTLETKEKDCGSEIRNFSVRIACKIHTQGWRNVEKYYYELQINLYVSIVEAKKFCYH